MNYSKKAQRKKLKQNSGEICLCKNCADKYDRGEIEMFTFGPLPLHKNDSRRQKVIEIFNRTAEKIRGLGFRVGNGEDMP